MMAGFEQQVYDAISSKDLESLELIFGAIDAINEKKKNNSSSEKKLTIDLNHAPALTRKNTPGIIPKNFNQIKAAPLAQCAMNGWIEGFELLRQRGASLSNMSTIFTTAATTSGKTVKMPSGAWSIAGVAILFKQRAFALHAFYWGCIINKDKQLTSENSEFYSELSPNEKKSSIKFTRALLNLQYHQQHIAHNPLNKGFIVGALQADPKAVFQYIQHIINEFVTHVSNKTCSSEEKRPPQSTVLSRIKHPAHLKFLISTARYHIEYLQLQQAVTIKTDDTKDKKIQPCSTSSQNEITFCESLFDLSLTHLRSLVDTNRDLTWPGTNTKLFSDNAELKRYVQRNRFSVVETEQVMLATPASMKKTLTTRSAAKDEISEASTSAAAASIAPPSGEAGADSDDSGREFDSDKDITITKKESRRNVTAHAAQQRVHPNDNVSAKVLTSMSVAITSSTPDATNDANPKGKSAAPIVPST